MNRIVIISMICIVLFSCENKKDKKQETQHLDCISEIVKALQTEFKTAPPAYLEPYKAIQKDLNDFTQHIPIDSLKNVQDKIYSKSYFLNADWNLELIETDNCEDTLFITFDEENNLFVIQINSCSIYEEDGEEHVVESTLIFEYTIKENCTYTFERINAAG